jgi:dipeptidase D
MNEVLLKLEPAVLWKHFKALCDIPRPSKKEGKAIDYVYDFGQQLGLETIKDDVGNIIIRKPATGGMEDRKTVVLQGHLDMVPQKNSDKDHDFETDPIEALVEGEWVTANGTTLGSDNGIGVAAALAVLESKELKHGPVEALFTIDEETGMTGAFGLKPGLLKGDILINMDSEEEGELYVGCAGGLNANAEFSYTEVPVQDNVVAYTLSVTGLKGGHSGMDINLGRANSNKLLTRFLKYASNNYSLRLASIDGGSLRNAIPRESFAVVTIPAEKENDFLVAVSDFEKIFKLEMALVEPDLKFSAEKTGNPSVTIDPETQINLIHAVHVCPNGVIRVSDSMEGLVETSTNLAVVKSENGKIRIQCLLRSSVDTAKDDLASRMQSLFQLAAAEVKFDGGYPGWNPNPDSAILKVMKGVYSSKFDREPEMKAIHAGLECGLLGGVYPNLDMISFGPTIKYPHSPDEKVHIESVQKFWDFLVDTLENIPGK